MRITLYTDYALRVLLYVAAKDDRSARIADIAEAFRISKNHLTKVVHRLAGAGYLETARGKHGGVRLLREPETINVGSLVREIEDTLSVLGCLTKENYCTIGRACILKGAFAEATDAFLSVLERYTLQDLIEPRAALADLLGIENVVVSADSAAKRQAMNRDLKSRLR